VNAILSSFAAFLAAGVRPRTPLAQAIRLVLVIKLIAIGGIGLLMLAGSERAVVDPIAVARLIGPPMSPDGGGR
jgi:hypothetical protein